MRGGADAGARAAIVRGAAAGRLLPALLVLSLSAACTAGGPPSGARAPAPAVPVTAAFAGKKDVPVQVRAIGNVEAYATVSVKTMVAGQITRVAFREGDDVRRGQLLFEIDPRSYDAAIHTAEATLAKDEALRDNAEKDVKRYEFLIAKDLIPRQQYDQVVSNAKAMEATVGADRAAVENARVQRSYCTIFSPIDGRTGSLLVQEGNVVKANDVPLVVINRVVPIRVSFAVPETALPEIRKYRAAGPLAVEAFPGDGKDGAARGTLSFVANAVDTATGTIALKGTFPNSDRRLWPGEFVNVVLTLTVRPGAVVVPSRAIQTGQAGPYVFVVQDNLTVVMRPVVPGSAAGEESIVERGLSAGERVVTDGQLRLVPGARVEIKTPAPGT